MPESAKVLRALQITHQHHCDISHKPLKKDEAFHSTEALRKVLNADFPMESSNEDSQGSTQTAIPMYPVSQFPVVCQSNGYNFSWPS